MAYEYEVGFGPSAFDLERVDVCDLAVFNSEAIVAQPSDFDALYSYIC